MPEPTVRTVRQDEVLAASRVVSTSMLVSLADEVTGAWADYFEPDRTHCAFAADGTIVGTARWFPTRLSVPGSDVSTGAVTAVAVLPNHRRQGHLRRMMGAQLHAMADERCATAVLIAAEWPIYGHYGYGSAVEACGWEIDRRAARFVAPRTGTVSLVRPEELRPALAAMHDARLARTPGGILRDDLYWERAAGLSVWPGRKDDLGQRRGALWHDEEGQLGGAVSYSVEDQWTNNRPAGTVDVGLLVGATDVAERELWRHLCDIDWAATVVAGVRGIDDPLPLWLTDARLARQVDRSDCIWVRILSVPEALGARRATVADRVVVEVVDDLGFAAGRWSLDLGPDGAEVTATSDAADVTLPVGALGAAYLGGTAVARLHQAGLVEEGTARGVARLSALLSTPTAPWAPTTF